MVIYIEPKKMLLLFIFLIMIISLQADLALPNCEINLEIKSETGTEPPTTIDYEIWLDGGYSNKVTNSDSVSYTTYDLVEPNGTDDLGLMVIATRNVFPNFLPGNVLHVWVKDTTNNHEGTTSITLSYENIIQLGGNNALQLVSTIQSIAANTSSAEPYNFNGGARNNSVDCTVALKSPTNTTGNITIGLLNAIPATIPVSEQAIDLGFYFDAKAATIGSGNFEFTISWDDEDVSLENTTNRALFITEDGKKWINTDNYANGTSDFNWLDNRASDQVSFKIDHLPHSIVFGDGATTTYTESIPDVPASFMFYDLDGDGLTLQWVPSTFPDESYILQSSINPYTGWSDVSNPTINTVGNVKRCTITETASSYKFFRVKATNHSSGSSNWSTQGYKKNDLNSGWNLLSYSLGEDQYNVNIFYDSNNGIENIATGSAVKIWDYDTQSWIAKSESANDVLNKGNCFMVKTTGSGTWYNSGAAPAEDMQFTMNYKSEVSGYNVIMRPWDESSATTVSGLHTTLFGSSITDGDRTVSWFDQSAGGICIYDGYKLVTSGSIAPGDPVIVHMKSGDAEITWPTETRKRGVK